MMKKNKIIFTLALLLSLTVISCGKGDNEELPTNDPSGNYLYESHSVYYAADGSVEYEATAAGSISIEASTNKLVLKVTPNVGYTFTIKGENIDVYGDTSTFSIYHQQIELKDNSYNVQGVNGLDVGNLGKFDGYFTDKRVVFDYRSINIETLESVKTTTTATKRN